MERRTKIILIMSLCIPVVGYLIYRITMLFNITHLNEDKLRQCDSMGCGYYGAPRGSRKHNGIDILAKPNEVIMSPFKSTFSKFGYVYSGNYHFRYIELKGKGINSALKMRLMYLAKPETFNHNIGDEIIKGASLGLVQDIANHHGGGMQNHVHVELRILGIRINPTPFFKLT